MALSGHDRHRHQALRQVRREMVIATRNLIGIGLYTTDEAAHLARVSPRTMRRWVFGDGAGDPVMVAQLGGSEKIVTFLDFVQALAVRAVRVSDSKFPLPKIRQACFKAMDQYSLRYPLAARDHRIYLFGPRDKPSQCEMVISLGADESGDERLLQLTGKKQGNFIITKIAEPFMHGLEFSDASQFAERYTAFEQNGRKIVMDPHQRFGEPYLLSCGYTAQALWEASRSEGSVESAARNYGVEIEDVELACSYFDFLVGSNAA